MDSAQRRDMGTGMRTFLWTGYAASPLDWPRFLGRKNKLLQATSRSRSRGALWPIDECIPCLLQ